MFQFHSLRRLLPAAALLLAASLCSQGPSLGTAANFAVLGASTVTSAGATSLTGDLGVAPGTAITGFPPGVLIGTAHPGDAVAIQAQADLTVAVAALASSVRSTILTGQDLGGMKLTPGVYCYAAAAQLTGTLTLDGLGSPTSVFVIRTGSTLKTAAASAVTLTNGAAADRVFWDVGSSATLGANTDFAGNLIALASITLSTGTVVNGRVLARTAAVTMTASVVSVPGGRIASVTTLGTGCGSPAPVLGTSDLPVLGNAAFTLRSIGSADVPVVLLLSFELVNNPIAPGCTQFVGSGSVVSYNLYLTDPRGLASMNVPIPAVEELDGMSVYWQTAEFLASGPLFGTMSLSNGLMTVLGVQ